MIQCVNFVSQSLNILSRNSEKLLVLAKNINTENFDIKVKGEYQAKGLKSGYNYKGTWWFCVWDKEKKTVKLIRDKHGYTSIFYLITDQTLYISEDIQSLLKIKKTTLNLKRIAALMIFYKTDEVTQTHFNEILSLPAGYELIIQENTLEIQRYWFPENTITRKYSNTNEYAEELYLIFENSVKKALDKSVKPASMLSGGLDSSSVVCVAANLLQKAKKNLETYTHIPLFGNEYSTKSHRFGDETEHAKTVLQKYSNIKANWLKSEQISPIKGLKKYLEISAEIIHGASNAFWLYDLHLQAAINGHDLLLSGENGNGTISFDGIRSLLPWNHPFYSNMPLRRIKDKIYGPISHQLKSFLNIKEQVILDNYPHFLNKNIICELDLDEAYKSDHSTQSKVSSKAKMSTLIDLARVSRMPPGGVFAKHFGYSMADPTGSEDVIEYCFSLPNEAFFGTKGCTRNIARTMMKGRLPEKIRTELKFGLQSSDITARLLNKPHEVDDALMKITKNHTFNYLFDVKKLQNYWNLLKISDPKKANIGEVNSLLKSIMAGFFILKYE